MKYFTKTQVEELRKQLATLGVRDTDLPEGDKLTGEEEVAIIQNGENRRVKIKDMFAGNIPADIIDHLQDGKSAYEIAVDNGFVGTEAEWLASLKGPQGEPGSTNVATSITVGGIKLGYPQNEKNYPVVLDGLDRAYVNVPWNGEGGGGGGTGQDGGYYEIAFKATDTNTPPALPPASESISGGWNHYAEPNVLGDKVIWMATRFVSGDGSYGSWLGPWRITGQGEKGVDGDTMEYVYAVSSSEQTSSVPNVNSGIPDQSSSTQDPREDHFIPNGWTDHPSGVTANNRFEFMAFRVKTHSASNRTGEWSTFIGPTVWSSYGKNGTDGDGVEYIFFAGSSLPVSNLPETWTNDENFQDREYIRESASNIWFDDPVDLNGMEYGMGTKQWVCTRKKYADSTSHPVYGTNPYWHAYSEPALWSYYAVDGDAGTGIVIDTDNDMITLGLKASGYNYALTQQSVVTISDGAVDLTTTITSVRVQDSHGTNYPSQSWITYSGNTVTATFLEDAINLSEIQLLAYVTASATVDGETVSRTTVIKIIGVHFGSDGADGSSYKLVLSNNVIRKYSTGSYFPAAIRVSCSVVRGTDVITSYDPVTISQLGNFHFAYYSSNPIEITSTTVNVTRTMVDRGYEDFMLFYGNVSNGIMIDRERVMVISDGEPGTSGNDGGSHELAFRTAQPNVTLTSNDLPANGYPLNDANWSHSAANSDGTVVVWMTQRFVNGDGSYENWEGPWIISGDSGEAGIDGDTYEYIYALTTDSSTTPSNPNSGIPAVSGKTVTDPDFVPQGWTDNPTGVDDVHKVEWFSMRKRTGSQQGTGGTWSLFSTPAVWSTWGRQGTDGDGVEYIYFSGTSYPSILPSSWDYTTTDYQNTREYIARNSGWTDDPVDLDLASIPYGTKQWVAIRKRYADDTAHPTFGTDPYWHAYSSPKLWNRKAKDGTSGNGFAADFSNDMMAVPIKQNGYNNAYSSFTLANVYREAELSDTIVINSISVLGSDGADYTDLGIAEVSMDALNQIDVNIAADTVNFDAVQLIVTAEVYAEFYNSGSAEPVTVTREISFSIIGIHFGEDGASYSLVTDASVIRKNTFGSMSPSNVNVLVRKTVGLTGITSYTPSNLPSGFSLTYERDDSGTQNVVSGSIPTANTTSNLRVYLKYRYNNTDILVDQETIPIIVDGVNGSNAGRLDLDNENDSMLYNEDGQKVTSDNIVTHAHLYIGNDDMTSSATNWNVVYDNCTGSISGNTVTITALTGMVAMATISCSYGGNVYQSILSMKRIVGDVKYDLYISPNSISFNTTSQEYSANQITVKVIRTDAISRQVLTSLAGTGLTLFADNTAVSTYGPNGYVHNVLFANSSHVFSLYKGAEFQDEETVPISKVANGTNGINGSDGLNGKIMRGVTEYTPTPQVSYEGLLDVDPSHKFYDVVMYNNQLYYCNTYLYNNRAAATYTPGASGSDAVWVRADNFKFVATDLLLAENAYIGFLTNRGLYLKDSGGNVVGGAQGSDGIVFWAGGANPTNAAFQAYKNGLIVAENAHIRGSVFTDVPNNARITINDNDNNAIYGYAQGAQDPGIIVSGSPLSEVLDINNTFNSWGSSPEITMTFSAMASTPCYPNSISVSMVNYESRTATNQIFTVTDRVTLDTSTSAFVKARFTGTLNAWIRDEGGNEISTAGKNLPTIYLVLLQAVPTANPTSFDPVAKLGEFTWDGANYRFGGAGIVDLSKEDSGKYSIGLMAGPSGYTISNYTSSDPTKEKFILEISGASAIYMDCFEINESHVGVKIAPNGLLVYFDPTHFFQFTKVGTTITARCLFGSKTIFDEQVTVI